MILVEQGHDDPAGEPASYPAGESASYHAGESLLLILQGLLILQKWHMAAPIDLCL